MATGVQTCSLVKRLASKQILVDDSNGNGPPVCFTPEPFFIFPEELWLMILENVDFTTQANRQKVYYAFPEFVWLFRKRFLELHFKQVSPRVFEFQPSESLPQVCSLPNKDWCSAVYDFLQQHPSINSSIYSGDGGNFNRIVPQSDFNYWLTPVSYSDLQAPVTFQTTEEVKRFQEANKAKLFISKAITTFLSPVKLDLVRSNNNPTKFYAAWIEFFYEFGSARQNVSLEMFFRDLLKHIPNVQSLCIKITDLKNDIPLRQEWKNGTDFPPLPHLKALQILPSLDNFDTKRMESAILQYFLNGGYLNNNCKREIKTLKLTVFPEEAFCCVVEYILENKTDFPKDVPKFRKILARRKRRSVHIQKVNIAMRISRLFQWMLDRRHLAEQLIIDDLRYNMVIPVDQPIPPLRCVKYLRISDHSIHGFQFLTALPSLEHLHVQCRESSAKKCFIENDGSLNPFALTCLTTILSHYLYRNKVPKECNIWEKLSSLQSLAVEEEGVLSKHFVRNYNTKPVVFKQSIELVDLT